MGDEIEVYCVGASFDEDLSFDASGNKVDVLDTEGNPVTVISNQVSFDGGVSWVDALGNSLGRIIEQVSIPEDAQTRQIRIRLWDGEDSNPVCNGTRCNDDGSITSTQVLRVLPTVTEIKNANEEIITVARANQVIKIIGTGFEVNGVGSFPTPNPQNEVIFEGLADTDADNTEGVVDALESTADTLEVRVPPYNQVTDGLGDNLKLAS